jgi:superoxide dismutase, Cu-Zn family
MEATVKKAKWMAMAVTFCAAGIFAAAQAPAAPAGGGGQGRGGGRGAPQGAGAPQAPGGPGGPGGPARGITINANPVQKAHADITGNGITGTAEFVEYAQGNGTIVQVIVSVTGLPAGLHGMHIHAVGKCDAPAFTTAGGHFDPGPSGNMDADMNHPFHSGDLPNIGSNQGANGLTANVTAYTTRFGLGGPLSLFDADGSAIVIHANPDTLSTGTAGQGVAGGPRLACGVITKS